MRLLLCSCLLMILFGCKSQKGAGDKEYSPKQNLKFADQLFNMGSYYNAIDYYAKVHESTPDNPHVAWQLAESYFLSRDYVKAEEWYKKTMDQAAAKYPLVGFKYAQAQKMNGKYAEAKKSFTNFIKTYKQSDAQNYKKIVRVEKEGCDYALEAQKSPANIKMIHMDENINAAYTEFAPMPMGDDKFFYATLYSDSVIELDGKKNVKHFSRIFQLDRNGGEYTNKQKLPPAINDNNYHTGNGTFSFNGSKYYFTKCQQTETGKVNCEIYVTNYKKGDWGTPEKLEFNINMEGYTSTHPTIGPYKRGGQVLYFVSDRPGGVGGMDIWYSVISRNGKKYGEPQNAGRKINSLRDDITPYFDNKSKTFYFSSNGRVGMGGYDIFRTEGMMKKWTKPENMGPPLNTRVDDMYFVPEKSGQGGYLVSNRPGSIALKSPTCCDDIYRFEYRNVINVAVQGYVYDESDPSKTPINDATVSLYIANSEDESGEPLAIASEITKDGNMYFFDLNPNKEYKLSAAKKGYFSGKSLFTDYEGVSTMGITRSDTFRVDLFLKKMELNVAYRLQNIYYDFDKATLRPESIKTLDSLLILLREHPAIKIELGSHTDSKGSNEYNIQLSQKRAESVVKFLIKNKISPERLVPKGYGEEVAIAPNSNPDGSDNPEGRQLNRRTEFKIIGELENVKYMEPGEEEY